MYRSIICEDIHCNAAFKSQLLRRNVLAKPSGHGLRQLAHCAIFITACYAIRAAISFFLPFSAPCHIQHVRLIRCTVCGSAAFSPPAHISTVLRALRRAAVPARTLVMKLNRTAQGTGPAPPSVAPASTAHAPGGNPASRRPAAAAASAPPLPASIILSSPRQPRARAARPLPAAGNATVAATAATAEPASTASAAAPKPPASFSFVCPICLTTPFKLPGLPAGPQGLSCGRCARTFDSSDKYVDLTLTSGISQKVRRYSHFEKLSCNSCRTQLRLNGCISVGAALHASITTLWLVPLPQRVQAAFMDGPGAATLPR